MQQNATIAIAAHLHVLLRRKTGRVTDTEWLALNDAYATEIIRFARAQALERGAGELAEWADKLEQAMRKPQAPPLPPAGIRSATLPPATPVAPGPQDPPSGNDDDGARYVGRIR